MKLSPALIVAVLGLLMTALDAAQQVRGRSTREGRGGVRGKRQLMMNTGKSKPNTGGTGYWSGTPTVTRPNPTEATITSITVTSNSGTTAVTNSNDGSGRGSGTEPGRDPVEQVQGGDGDIAAQMAAIIDKVQGSQPFDATPNGGQTQVGGGSSTVYTPSSPNGGSGGATITGITVNSNGGGTTSVTNNGSGRGSNSDPVEGTGASVIEEAQ